MSGVCHWRRLGVSVREAVHRPDVSVSPHLSNTLSRTPMYTEVRKGRHGHTFKRFCNTSSVIPGAILPTNTDVVLTSRLKFGKLELDPDPDIGVGEGEAPDPIPIGGGGNPTPGAGGRLEPRPG